MNVLVTGGAGFIGSNLVRRLAESGERVRVLDDLSTGSRDNLAGFAGAVELLEGDVRDPATVLAAMRGVEVVYHLAAMPTVARSVADPLRCNAVNVEGTLTVLLTARDLGVRRVVYASSSSVYGDQPTLPKHEDMPAVTLSPYAASKFAGESYCRAFAHVYGLETVSLRFFNVFGPRQDPSSEYAAVIPRFAGWMLAGEQPVIYGDGGQTRDFTYVTNAVEACLLAASAGREAVGEAMNVGCGGRISLLALVDVLNELLGSRLEPLFAAARPGDVRHSEADISKAARLIGYRPLVGLREGLEATVGWLSERLGEGERDAARATLAAPEALHPPGRR